ncbi:MAG: hypothetical protein WCB19_05790 [Thermoplasmata archaeon]
MRCELLLAVAFIALVAFVPNIVSASPAPVFKCEVLQPQVPQGAPIVAEVTGPPNATFSLSLYPLPFNTSQPVLSALYQLPAVATLPNGTAIGEVSVNTSILGIEGYLMVLETGNGTPFAKLVVAVTTGIPSVQIVSTLEQIEFNLAVNASRVSALFYEQGRLQNGYFYVIGLTGVEFIVLLLVVLETRTSVGEKRFMRSLKRIGHKIEFKGKAGMSAGHWDIPETVATSNRERVWVADCCPRGQKRHTRAELLEHGMSVHRLTEHEFEPRMRISKDARREIREELQAVRAPAIMHPPKAPVPVLDLTQIQNE